MHDFWHILNHNYSDDLALLLICLLRIGRKTQSIISIKKKYKRQAKLDASNRMYSWQQHAPMVGISAPGFVEGTLRGHGQSNGCHRRSDAVVHADFVLLDGVPFRAPA